MMRFGKTLQIPRSRKDLKVAKLCPPLSSPSLSCHSRRHSSTRNDFNFHPCALLAQNRKLNACTHWIRLSEMLFQTSVHLWKFVHLCKVYPPREVPAVWNEALTFAIAWSVCVRFCGDEYRVYAFVFRGCHQSTLMHRLDALSRGELWLGERGGGREEAIPQTRTDTERRFPNKTT
jgi:hypothetical protein